MSPRWPGNNKQQGPDCRAAKQNRKPGVPAVVLDERPQAPAREHCARIPKDTGEAYGGGRRAFRGEVRARNGQKALGAIHEKAGGAKQARNPAPSEVVNGKSLEQLQL